MPVMMPARRGVSYSEALAEAYANAPDDEVILDTLEIYHPLFDQTVYVVQDTLPLTATLEASALDNPSTAVVFKPVRFGLTLPTESESSANGEMIITVSNVARYLMPKLDLLHESTLPIIVTWRPYLSSDLSGPHMNPPLRMTVSAIEINLMDVQIRASISSLVNRRFPAVEYSVQTHAGLAVR